MNRATDEDVRAEFEAAISKLHPSAVENIHAAMKQDKSVSWDLFRAGFAAAEALLSLRMPTREAIRDALVRGTGEWLQEPRGKRTMQQANIDAIADLFGITD